MMCIYRYINIYYHHFIHVRLTLYTVYILRGHGLLLEITGGNQNPFSADRIWITIDSDLGSGVIWHANKTRRFMERNHQNRVCVIFFKRKTSSGQKKNAFHDILDVLFDGKAFIIVVSSDSVRLAMRILLTIIN